MGGEHDHGHDAAGGGSDGPSGLRCHRADLQFTFEKVRAGAQRGPVGSCQVDEPTDHAHAASTKRRPLQRLRPHPEINVPALHGADGCQRHPRGAHFRRVERIGRLDLEDESVPGSRHQSCSQHHLFRFTETQRRVLRAADPGCGVAQSESALSQRSRRPADTRAGKDVGTDHVPKRQRH